MSKTEQDGQYEKPVIVYGLGLLYISACANEGLSKDEIETAVNIQEPSGISSRWHISDKKNFATGELNPCPCNQVKGRLHYLLSC